MNPFIKKKLKTQFNLYLSIFSFFIILSTSYFYVEKYKHDIYLMFDKYGKNILENISPLILSNIIIEDYFRIQDTLKKVANNNRDIVRIAVTDNSNTIISDTEISNLGNKFSTANNPNLSTYSLSLKVNNVHYGDIYLFLDNTKIKDEINNLYAKVLASIIFFFIVSLVIGHLLALYLSKPLNEFLNSIEIFKNKNIPPSSEKIIAPQEISVIYENFYEMIKKIQDRESKLETTLKELHNIKEFIQQILDSLPIAVLTLDNALRVNFYNKKFYEMFDLKNEITGMDIYELFNSYGIDEIVNFIKESKEGDFRRIQIKGMPKKFYDISIFKINTDKGFNVGILLEDVSDNVERDNLIFHAQKMDALGVLAGGIAHDINNVLAAMKNSLSVISMTNPPNEIKPMLDILEKSIYRASNIVKQVLSFSRKQETLYKCINLNKLLTDTVEIIKNTADKSIDIQTFISDKSLDILGDENQIEQAILNICINACHAMTLMKKDGNKGGVLSIKLSETCLPSYTDIDSNQEPFALISISDTGVGISKDNLSKIFDPFFTTKKSGEGTGLGLSIVHRIIKEHNGYIKVYSEEGKGTTFNIFLPLFKGEYLETKEKPPEYPKYNLSVLLIDDDKLLLDSNYRLLQNLGIDVTAESDPMRALNTFMENKDKFDICILDIMMPKISGTDLAKKILEINRSQKIILTSGFFNDTTVDKFIDEFQLTFLPKPFSINQLIVCLEKYGINPIQQQS